MRIAATCEHCGREFLFFELYNAAPEVADRCPHCYEHLGLPHIRGLAASADHAATVLEQCLREIYERAPSFDVRPESVLQDLSEWLDRQPRKAA